MTPKDTGFNAAKNHRNVHRVHSIMPCAAGTFILWIEPDETGKVHVSSLTCLGLALVETWREDQGEKGHPDTYVGPNWLRVIVPVYQNIEGILMPYNDDGNESDGGIVVMPATPEEEVYSRFKTLNIDEPERTAVWRLVENELLTRRRAR